MKHFLLAIMLLTFSSFLYSQSPEEKAVKKVLDTFLLAMKNTDVATAAHLLTDNYRMIGDQPLSCVTNKTQRLSSIQYGQIKYEPVDFEKKYNHLYISDTTADIYGGTLITYRPCNDAVKESKVLTFDLHFIKMGEHWLLSLECIGEGCIH